MKNAKWVVALRPMRREFVDWYGQRNWSREAHRQDDDAHRRARAARRALHAGPQRIAGIAYAGDRGDRRWSSSAPMAARPGQIAELLEPAAGRDAWVRWQGRFTLAARRRSDAHARARPTGRARCSPSLSAWPSRTARPAGTRSPSKPSNQHVLGWPGAPRTGAAGGLPRPRPRAPGLTRRRTAGCAVSRTVGQCSTRHVPRTKPSTSTIGVPR